MRYQSEDESTVHRSEKHDTAPQRQAKRITPKTDRSVTQNAEQGPNLKLDRRKESLYECVGVQQPAFSRHVYCVADCPSVAPGEGIKIPVMFVSTKQCPLTRTPLLYHALQVEQYVIFGCGYGAPAGSACTSLVDCTAAGIPDCSHCSLESRRGEPLF